MGSGGFGSRIMEEIRVKRGLAYSAYGRFAINRTNSYFWGYLQTKLASQDEAIGSIKETVGEFVKRRVVKLSLGRGRLEEGCQKNLYSGSWNI